MKQRAAKKPPVPDTTGVTTAVVIENVAQTRKLQETALHDDRPTNTGSGSNEDDHDDRLTYISLFLYFFDTFRIEIDLCSSYYHCDRLARRDG